MQERLTPLLQLLSEIKDTLNRLAEILSKCQESESANKEERDKSESERVVRLPAEVTSYYRSEESRRPISDKREALRTALELVGAGTAVTLVIITAITLCVFAKQLSEMRKATKAATDAAAAAQQANTDASDRFRTDERPYVWVTSNGVGAPKFIPGAGNPAEGQVIWSWHYTNYGKTPAYNIQWRHYMSIDGGPFLLSYRMSPGGDKGAPLPPTQDVFTSVVSKPLTRDVVDRATAINGKGIRIRIVMSYTDSHGGHYETGIELCRLNTGDVSYCGNGNYIK